MDLPQFPEVPQSVMDTLDPQVKNAALALAVFLNKGMPADGASEILCNLLGVVAHSGGAISLRRCISRSKNRFVLMIGSMPIAEELDTPTIHEILMDADKEPRRDFSRN